jgi:hypothetical protein
MTGYIPPKHRFLQEPHVIRSQKTAFFMVFDVGMDIRPEPLNCLSPGRYRYGNTLIDVSSVIIVCCITWRDKNVEIARRTNIEMQSGLRSTFYRQSSVKCQLPLRRGLYLTWFCSRCFGRYADGCLFPKRSTKNMPNGSILSLSA